ncbi:hypothetical protein FDUTEX481_02294 [Tolypothrix sp. PCC 7601]|nr:hypothetical protein FDUTEX481_02294 [Tolypothrix sp. PCC 7601]BAY94076.1 hypothetical protein NIES3275_61210 [Microchaete diplosiphon NIES-3275]
MKFISEVSYFTIYYTLLKQLNKLQIIDFLIFTAANNNQSLTFC